MIQVVKEDVHRFSTQNDLDFGSMKGLVTALAFVDVVEQNENTVTAGTLTTR